MNIECLAKFGEYTFDTKTLVAKRLDATGQAYAGSTKPYATPGASPYTGSRSGSDSANPYLREPSRSGSGNPYLTETGMEDPDQVISESIFFT